MKHECLADWMKGSNIEMDGQYSWKRTEDAEIDLAELLRELCGQWKRIVACALAAALITGGYGWLKGRERSAAAISGTEEQAGETEPEDTKKAELTEAEELGVADAVRLTDEIRGLEMYLDNSVLMQMDPYHKARYVMLYCIDQTGREELPKITESYLSFVLNGGAADELMKFSRWDMDKSYLAELITAYQKTYSFPYLTVAGSPADSSRMTQALLCIEVTGRNIKEAERMALDLQEALENYSAEVKEMSGSHRLVFVSGEKSVTADSSLQSLQHDKKGLLSSDKAALKAMTEAFSDRQMEEYCNKAGVEAKERKEKADDSEPDDTVLDNVASGDAASDENSVSVMKYLLLGVMGGISAYGCIFSCWYILRDRVKSAEEMKRRYTFPVYGTILLENEGGRKARAVPRIRRDAFGHTQMQVMSRIRLACQEKGVAKLCAASDFVLDMAEKECLDSMAEQLKDHGISMTVVENVSADTDVWDTLIKTGNVLLLCRTGMTTHQMIDDTMIFYLENGITVTGAAVFFQNA